MLAPTIAILIAIYLPVGFLWPTLRVWRTTGHWPVVFSRNAAPLQRLLGFATTLLFCALLSLVVATAAGWSTPPHIPWLWPHIPFLGLSLMLLGALLTVVAQLQMGGSWRVGIDDRPTALVTSGLFRLSRNPVFLGLLLFLGGLALAWPSPWTATLWIVTLLALRAQVGYEERHLLALHGPAYLDYATRVGRFLPGLGRMRLERVAILTQ